MPNTRSFSNSKRGLFGLGIVLMALVGSCWHRTNLNPVINIPPPPPAPQPNGWDYFLQAASASVPEPQSFYDGTSRPEPTPDPAHAADFARKYPIRSREVWLKQNDKALSLLRQGLGNPCLHSARAQRIAKYSQMRQLGRLLTTESRVRAARGNWNSAAQSALDQIRFGNAVASGGAHIAWLVGQAISGSGISALKDVVEGLDANAARDAARQLQQLRQKAPTIADALQEDKWIQQKMYRDLFNRSDWRQQFAASVAQGEAAALGIDALMTGKKPTWRDTLRVRWEYLKMRGRMLSFSKHRIFSNYNSVADAAISAAKEPYKKETLERGSDYFSDIFVDSYARVHWSAVKAQTRSALLETALALHAYKSEQGAYPNFLEALSPHYLPAVPPDAFNANKPLRYKRNGATYRLWSVGPDAANNGGQPSHHASHVQSSQALIEPDSSGDFVYGINH